MRVAAFAPVANTPGRNPKTGKEWRDATGAFQPEARSWLSMHSDYPATGTSQLFLVDAQRPMSHRAHRVTEVLAQLQPFDLEAVAFFCHGWKNGIQLGFRTPQVRMLAGALSKHTSLRHVVLYACDSARDADAQRDDDDDSGPGGDGGFADRLRDSLMLDFGKPTTVWAHATAGHSTRNPYVRVFRPERSEGGEWVVDPDDPFWNKWRRALARDGLRLRFWRLSPEELRSNVETTRYDV